MLALVVASLVGEPVAAAETVAGWEISGSDGSCSMSQPNRGQATWLYLGRDLDGEQFVRVHDRRWAVKKGQAYAATLKFDGKPVTLQAIGSITDGAEPLPGFTAIGKADWQSSLATASAMEVTLEGQAPASIDLAGARAALTALEACVEAQRKAGAVALQSGPRVTAPMYLLPDDYPSRARAERREGRVVVRLTVDVKGKPAGCAIETSSGYADLDEQACKLAAASLRFKSAIATSGKPVEGSFQFPLVWRNQQL